MSARIRPLRIKSILLAPHTLLLAMVAQAKDFTLVSAVPLPLGQRTVKLPLVLVD